MNFIERLGRVDNRVIYALLIVVLIWPLVKPLGLPVSVGSYTQKTFAVIDSLNEGDTVYIQASYSVSGAGDVQPQAVAIVRHLFAKGVKIIFGAEVVDGPMVVEKYLLTVPEAAGKVERVDYINLGYLAGLENAISASAADIKQAYPLDFNGKPTDTALILDGIKGAGDVDMYLFFTTQNADMFVRQIGPYGVPIIGGLINTIVPQAEPYVHAGQLAGILAGLRGGAEYELLLKKPAVGLAAMDAQSMGHLLYIAFIILANIAYFGTHRKSKGAGAR
jgi:hypothetical protein